MTDKSQKPASCISKCKLLPADVVQQQHQQACVSSNMLASTLKHKLNLAFSRNEQKGSRWSVGCLMLLCSLGTSQCLRQSVQRCHQTHSVLHRFTPASVHEHWLSKGAIHSCSCLQVSTGKSSASSATSVGPTRPSRTLMMSPNQALRRGEADSCIC